MGRRLLLALSLGVSSTTLLHVLDQHIRTSIERTGRTGYELYVLFIDKSSISIDENNNLSDLFGLWTGAYPRHSYYKISLEDVFLQELNTTEHGSSLPNLPHHIALPDSTASRSDHLRTLFSSLSSPSSKIDIVSVLQTRLIVAKAKELKCETVIWGDSTTRLAERTLTETAKGRGFSLPWQTSDGIMPHGITFLFPMRELFRRELHAFSMLTSPPLTPLIAESSQSSAVVASSKDTTIDDLMGQYFASVEENYPSIVANVVRTTNKLKPSPQPGLSTICSICNVHIAPGTDGLYGWGGNTQVATSTTRYSEMICYGCSRSILGSKLESSVS